MNWETFYFVCFLSGLFLSAFSLLGGLGHFGFHVRLPHVSHLPGHVPMGVGRGLPHGGAGLRVGQGSGSHAPLPWWNTFSGMIFLCWFGAAGYLLTRYGSFVAVLVVVLAALSGVAGGAIVFFFLTRVLLPHEHELTADETEVPGVVGRVSAAIRAGGTGEIIYEQLGSVCSAPARSDDGAEVSKNEEVFVVRYEKGIAYVRRWDEVLGEETGSRDQRSGIRE
jgi:membrane protein implicated in regulation of membrane protease activity